MLEFDWSRFVLRFLTLPAHIPTLWWPLMQLLLFFTETLCNLSYVKYCVFSWIFFSSGFFFFCVSPWSILRKVPSIIQGRQPCFFLIPLLRFLVQSLVSRRFIVLQTNSCLTFYFITTYLWCSLPIFELFLVLLLPSFQTLWWFDSSISSVVFRFPIFITSTERLSMPNYIAICSLESFSYQRKWMIFPSCLSDSKSP